MKGWHTRYQRWTCDPNLMSPKLLLVSLVQKSPWCQPVFLSKKIEFVHGYHPWKSHASVETKKCETSTWTVFFGWTDSFLGNHRLPICNNFKGWNTCTYHVDHMFFTMLKLESFDMLAKLSLSPNTTHHKRIQQYTVIYMGFTEWICTPKCPSSKSKSHCFL